MPVPSPPGSGMSDSQEAPGHAGKRILMITPYFGGLPEWFDLFALSASYNRRYDWLIITDTPDASSDFPNIHFQRSTFQEYKERISDALSLNVSGIAPYKLCNFKPFFSIIHAKDIVEYDFWGPADMDVIWGDLHRFYPDELLSKYRVVSTHPDRLSGHFALLANRPQQNLMCLKIRNWRERVLTEEPAVIDEDAFSHRLFPMVRRFRRFGWSLMRFGARRGYNALLTGRVYAREMYTTPLIPLTWHDGTLNWEQPTEWTWQRGRVYSVRDGFEVPYVHFMNYKTARYLTHGRPAWEGMASVVHRPIDGREITSIRLGLDGIRAE